MKRFLLSAIIALGLHASPAVSGDDPYLGEIMLVGYDFCPRGWAEANGQLLDIASYDALFALYGTTFGGNGTVNFALPDLRGRVPIHVGTGPGLTTRELGDRSGQETVTLTESQMPEHVHSLSGVTLNGTVQASSSAGTTNTPAGKALSDSNRTSLYSDGSLDSSLAANSVSVSGTDSDVVAKTGGSEPHNNMPPFVTLRYCVALVGLFPPRD